MNKPCRLRAHTAVSATTPAHTVQRFTETHIDETACLWARRREDISVGSTSASLRPTDMRLVKLVLSNALSRQPTEYLS
jgi:hypothetical protein